MPPLETARPRHYLRWIVLLVVLILAYFVWRIVFSVPSPQMSTAATIPELVIPNAPRATATDYVAAQQDFQYLVSYTDAGFSPTTLRVKKGETVRFTNNASTEIGFTIASGTPQTIAHGAYVQYTASTSGSFTYSGATFVGTLTVIQ